jgi:CheY-like chemotaxis protein
MSQRNLLFLDDEIAFLDRLKSYYAMSIEGNSNLKIDFFHSHNDLLDQSEKINNADVVVADLRLGNYSGLDFLETIHRQNKNAKLILITGQLISEEEQLRCKKIDADFLFKIHGVENLLDNIIFFSQPKNLKEKIKHVFISYRSVDFGLGVNKIVDCLEKNGISVWIDRENLMPGQDWQIAIRNAIEEGMLFLACFSSNYWSKTNNYMNEELNIAIDQLRKMPDDQIWFIPVKLENCKIPHFDIRQNKTLASKQFVKLYEEWDLGMNKIIKTIRST